MEELFDGIVNVSIQGQKVLRLLDFTGNQAKYEVIGFEEIPIIIVDSRHLGVQAAQDLLESGDLLAFAPNFNQPAKAHVFEDENNGLIIELTDTEETPPHHVLWIVVGLTNSLPVYEYIYEKITSLYPSRSGYAYVAIYQLSSTEQLRFAENDKSSKSYLPSLSTRVS